MGRWWGWDNDGLNNGIIPSILCYNDGIMCYSDGIISAWWFGTMEFYFYIYWEQYSQLTFIFFRGLTSPSPDFLWWVSLEAMSTVDGFDPPSGDQHGSTKHGSMDMEK